MRKLFCFIAFCLAALSSIYAVVPENISGIKISFVTLFNSQSGNAGSHHPYPRTPIQAPTVYLDGHTLSFLYAFSQDIELQLLDPDTVDDDEPTVVYSTTMYAGVQVVNLPTAYTGDYVLRLVVGQWYFIGEITL